MRAVIIRTPGTVEALSLIDVPTPTPGPGELRIRTAAAAINPVDIQTRAGVYHELGWVTQPDHTGLGWDLAGTISAVGDGIAESHPHLKIGTRLAALRTTLDAPLGSYAEEVIVPVNAAAAVPPGIPLDSAATVPLAGLTALQAVEILGPGNGQNLLITGATGSVGSFAIPLAIARGWAIGVLIRPDAQGQVSPDVSGPICTAAQDIVPASYDAVLDTAVVPTHAMAALRNGGHYVGVIPPNPPATERGITVDTVMVHADGSALGELLQLVDQGHLSPKVHQRYSLDRVAQAHTDFAAGGLRGRLVITI